MGDACIHAGSEPSFSHPFENCTIRTVTKKAATERWGGRGRKGGRVWMRRMCSSLGGMPRDRAHSSIRTRPTVYPTGEHKPNSPAHLETESPLHSSRHAARTDGPPPLVSPYSIRLNGRMGSLVAAPALREHAHINTK